MSEDQKFTSEYIEEAFQDFYDALVKFRDSIYKQIEPIVEKLAKLLDRIT